jgi:hypothetical protein
MANLVELKTFTDNRGSLSVIERELPFSVKRVFYIYNVDTSVRGGHRHKKTIQAAICVNGSCRIYNNNGVKEEYFNMDSPSKCLILQPEDWHQMDEFTNGSVLLVLASEIFDVNDYIFDPY